MSLSYAWMLFRIFFSISSFFDKILVFRNLLPSHIPTVSVRHDLSPFYPSDLDTIWYTPYQYFIYIFYNSARRFTYEWLSNILFYIKYRRCYLVLSSLSTVHLKIFKSIYRIFYYSVSLYTAKNNENYDKLTWKSLKKDINTHKRC